jgi:hypothetical protein
MIHAQMNANPNESFAPNAGTFNDSDDSDSDSDFGSDMQSDPGLGSVDGFQQHVVLDVVTASHKKVHREMFDDICAAYRHVERIQSRDFDPTRRVLAQHNDRIRQLNERLAFNSDVGVVPIRTFYTVWQKFVTQAVNAEDAKASLLKKWATCQFPQNWTELPPTAGGSYPTEDDIQHRRQDDLHDTKVEYATRLHLDPYTKSHEDWPQESLRQRFEHLRPVAESSVMASRRNPTAVEPTVRAANNLPDRDRVAVGAANNRSERDRIAVGAANNRSERDRIAESSASNRQRERVRFAGDANEPSQPLRTAYSESMFDAYREPVRPLRAVNPGRRRHTPQGDLILALNKINTFGHGERWEYIVSNPSKFPCNMILPESQCGGSSKRYEVDESIKTVVRAIAANPEEIQAIRARDHGLFAAAVKKPKDRWEVLPHMFGHFYFNNGLRDGSAWVSRSVIGQILGISAADELFLKVLQPPHARCDNLREVVVALFEDVSPAPQLLNGPSTKSLVPVPPPIRWTTTAAAQMRRGAARDRITNTRWDSSDGWESSTPSENDAARYYYPERAWDPDTDRMVSASRDPYTGRLIDMSSEKPAWTGVTNFRPRREKLRDSYIKGSLDSGEQYAGRRESYDRGHFMGSQRPQHVFNSRLPTAIVETPRWEPARRDEAGEWRENAERLERAERRAEERANMASYDAEELWHEVDRLKLAEVRAEERAERVKGMNPRSRYRGSGR